MRGKVDRYDSIQVGNGITPAYAGKRCLSTRFDVDGADHPRVCGEKSGDRCIQLHQTGSPPRMRGKASLTRILVSSAGITPAYAGKRCSVSSTTRPQQDHPRVCGEKACSAAWLLPSMGSPPRMRGKAVVDAGQDTGQRITPAYAGKRLKRSRSTVPPVAIVPLFPSVCNKPVVSDGSPAGRDAPLFLPAENAVPASPAYNLRSL